MMGCHELSPWHPGSADMSIFSDAGAEPSNFTTPLTLAVVAGSMGGSFASCEEELTVEIDGLLHPVAITTEHSVIRNKKERVRFFNAVPGLPLPFYASIREAGTRYSQQVSNSV